MDIYYIRNATFLFSYGRKRFLIDPMFAPKNKSEGILEDLPLKTSEITKDLDVILITNYNPDHFDNFAIDNIRKGLKVYIKDEENKTILRKLGFSNLTVLPQTGTTFAGTKLYSVPCCDFNGNEQNSMGIIFTNDTEKTIYITGDTRWNDKLKPVMERFKPDYIIANCGGKCNIGLNTLALDDLKYLHEASPESKIIISHVNTISDCEYGIKEIKKFAKEHKFDKSLIIPKCGEYLKKI